MEVLLEHQTLSSPIFRKLVQPDREIIPHLDEVLIEETKHILDMPAEQYHGIRQRMSSSGIKKYMRTPRHFLNSWQGLEEEEDKDCFRIGRAAHMMLLETQKFREQHIVEPEFTGFTQDGRVSKTSKEAKEKREAWKKAQNKDALILTQAELDNMIGMIESVLENKVAANLLGKGIPESTFIWTDEETKVMCKARPDYIAQEEDGSIHLIDFKTAADVTTNIFANQAAKLNYHVSMAFYHDAVVKFFKRQPESITLIVVEKTPPFESVVYPMEDPWFEHGQAVYKSCLRGYRKNFLTNTWPQFRQGAVMLPMPHWKMLESTNYEG